jgi:hypothetical protein
MIAPSCVLGLVAEKGQNGGPVGDVGRWFDWLTRHGGPANAEIRGQWQRDVSEGDWVRFSIAWP